MKKNEEIQLAVRMGKALQKTIDVYTEIDIDTLCYRQVNLCKEQYFSVAEEGSYIEAFEHMCKEEISLEDVQGVRAVLQYDQIRKNFQAPNGPDRMEVRYHLKNASPVLFMESTILFMRGEEKRYVIVLAKDVTRETKTLKAALTQAKNASSAKTEFFSRMSHDMRTPMNGILGLANLSEDETDVTVLKKNIKKIQQSGEYLLGLINDTLEFQKIESGKLSIQPQPMKVSEMVEDVFSMVLETAKEKGIDFRVIPKDIRMGTYVMVDPMRIKQVFVNLLSNAVKFTPSGGVIETLFECVERKNGIAYDVITITDTGVGMSKEFLEHKIFKPFSQEANALTPKYAGTGLGLSIVKQLVELMGGSIEVESELGVGTRFTIHIGFELVEEGAVEDFSKSSIPDKKHISRILNGKRILIAEDHPLNEEIEAKLLQKEGCIIVWAKNGQECVRLFESMKPGYFDLILMDIRMPVMDGLEAARKIRTLKRKDAVAIPIIAMTANAYDTDIKQSMEAGMDAHLSKPIEPQKMYETIAACITTSCKKE